MEVKAQASQARPLPYAGLIFGGILHGLTAPLVTSNQLALILMLSISGTPRYEI